LTQLSTNPSLTLKLDKTVPTYEATIGGPVRADRLWFFGAMRSQKQESQRTTVGTNIAYTRTNDEQRYEGKLTYTPKVGHSIQGSYFKLNQVLNNFTGQNVADTQSLTNQGQPQDLVSVQYTGVVTSNFSLSAQYSARSFALENTGANTTDRINGTLVLDLQNGYRYWSPTFCAGSVCEGDERRDNENAFVKGSYFLTNSAYGAHHFVFGYDYFNDNITANTHQSGSDYRVRGTSSVISNGVVYPVFLPNANTTLDYNPLLARSEGSNLRVHSFFLNDNWRVNDRVTLNAGVRLDKNDATDGDGDNVGDDTSLSPRVSAIWDPQGDGKWAVSGSYARYTMALTSNLAASTARAGNPATLRWVYQGSAINPPGTPVASLVSTADAIRRVFEWHDATGGDKRLPLAAANVPGVNIRIVEPLSSPYSMEYSGGVSRTIAARGSVRADVIYRDFRNFYSLKTDLTTGPTSDELGNRFDLSHIENTNRTERKYIGLTTQASYELGAHLSVGGNYTLSHATGDLEGETVNGGPSGATVNSYPEYRVPSWNYPEGDLLIDQRHRARMWATYNVPMASTAGAIVIGLLQQIGSGVPYAAIGTVNPTNFIRNPGYLTPPAQLEYFFLGRNPFRTETTYRTDLSVNYAYRLGRVSDVQPQLFFHGEVLNLFNQFQLCGCGENVFRNGGITDLTTIGQGVQLGTPFDPYTTQPVEGTHWRKAANFGQALNAFAYTSPRIFRFSVGVKF
jgi:TonB dependent receptor